MKINPGGGIDIMNKMIWKNIKMLLKIFLIIISVSACSFGEGGEN